MLAGPGITPWKPCAILGPELFTDLNELLTSILSENLQCLEIASIGTDV
jgi:hypothetical protein